jgi:hypothetical protein
MPVMAVLRCPDCGDLYLVATDRCESCGAALAEVAERAPVATEGRRSSVGTGEHEPWELHEWTMEGRRLLDGMLTSAEIPHAWQGSTLLAPVVEHDHVSALIDEVAESDARIGVDEEADGGSDEDEVDEVEVEADGVGAGAGGEVGYDLSGWDDLARGDLVAALAEAGIEHRWDADDDLVVAAGDEEKVDAVFAQLAPDLDEDGDLDDDGLDDALDGGVDDGLLVQETLSALFIAADRLQHNPLDGTSSRDVIEARDTARTLRLPFGFERLQWQGILTAADELVASVQPPADDDGRPPRPDDDAIREAAVDLRRRLRDVV